MEARREEKTVYVLKGAKAERELVELGAVSIDIDFVLEPKKLTEGIRPTINPVVEGSFIEWVCELLNSTSMDIDKLASKLQADAHMIATSMIHIAEKEGLFVPQSENSDRLTQNGIQNSFSTHKQLQHKAEIVSTGNLFD